MDFFKGKNFFKKIFFFSNLSEPEAVKKVSAVNISYTSAVIKWDKYESSQEKVEAQYQISGNFSQLKENSTFQENYKILSHLVPNTTYQVNVSVVLYNLSSANTNTTFTTYAGKMCLTFHLYYCLTCSINFQPNSVCLIEFHLPIMSKIGEII